jgi:lysophospholipase
MKTMVICSLLAIFPSSLHAIPEDSLMKEYNSLILPYIRENSILGEIKEADGSILKWQKISDADSKRIIILLGGHTESYVKYSELFYDLRDMGLSIYALDQRGQGFSSRMLADREKDHVDDYHRYVTDLEQFIADVVRPRGDAKVILLGHSLGGAVAAAYAEKHPSQLTGLILSSPYLGSRAGPFAMFILQALDFFGMGKEYVPGGGPFRIVPFEENKETHSRARHERKMQDYLDAPAIRLGYPTNHWMTQLEKMGREIRRNAQKLATPVLVLQAEKDEYADTGAQDDFCSNIKNCEKAVIAGAFHEVLIERDEIRDVALSAIRSFVQRCCR